MMRFSTIKITKYLAVTGLALSFCYSISILRHYFKSVDGNLEDGNVTTFNNATYVRMLEDQRKILAEGKSQIGSVMSSKELRTQGIDEKTLRVVHLDFKGAPPTINYLKSVLRKIADLGCTAVLMEYEDMFPFEGILRNISAKNAYNKAQIMELLYTCEQLGIEVIPLVQTFGHMEHALKLAEFMHLREVEKYPEVICPSKPESLTVIEEMIRQVMALHRNSKFIHIGCDEVYHLKVCPVCNARKISPQQIFSSHVLHVAKFVRKKYKGVTPLMWDDMMRNWANHNFLSSKIYNFVEPVVWIYGENVRFGISGPLWYWYTKLFPRIWIAGAFKGASGDLAILPNTQSRYDNVINWILFLKRSSVFKRSVIRGAILTGWSRYDHFAGLCELLPASVPSLVMNLLLLKSCTKHSASVMVNPVFKTFILKQTFKTLSCGFADEEVVDINSVRFEDCNFTERDAFFLMKEFIQIDYLVIEFYVDFVEQNGWLTAVNLNFNFSSPSKIEVKLNHPTWVNIERRITKYEKSVRRIFSKYFDKFTANEWLEQRLSPIKLKISKIKRWIAKVQAVKHWPRRPLIT